MWLTLWWAKTVTDKNTRTRQYFCIFAFQMWLTLWHTVTNTNTRTTQSFLNYTVSMLDIALKPLSTSKKCRCYMLSAWGQCADSLSDVGTIPAEVHDRVGHWHHQQVPLFPERQLYYIKTLEQTNKLCPMSRPFLYASQCHSQQLYL